MRKCKCSLNRCHISLLYLHNMQKEVIYDSTSFTSAKFTQRIPRMESSEHYMEFGISRNRWMRRKDEGVTPQPQSSQTPSRGRFGLLLVSVDSLRSLPASQDSPLGYRFLRSPRHCLWQCWNRSFEAAWAAQKKRITVKVIRFLWSIGDSNS